MKFDVGGAISRSFRLYFKLFWLLFLAALVVNAALALLTQQVTIDPTNMMSAIIGLTVLLVAQLVAASLVTALSTHGVGDVEAGEPKPSLAQLASKAAPVIGVIVGVSVLQAIGVTIGLLALLLPGVLALTWWAAAVPAAVIERTGVLGAFTRSVELVRGNAWGVFAYGLAMVIILILAGVAVVLTLSAVDLDSLLGATMFNIVADSVMTPFGAVGYAVLYFELRRLESPQPLPGDSWTSGGEASG